MKNITILILLVISIILGILYFTHECDLPEYKPDPRIDILKDSLTNINHRFDSVMGLANEYRDEAE